MAIQAHGLQPVGFLMCSPPLHYVFTALFLFPLLPSNRGIDLY